MIEATSAKALIEGKKIVISGVFSSFPERETLATICEWFGAKVTSSISKSTNYVIAGEAMGPAKFAKCKELNIPIVTEVEFVQLMQNDTVVIPEGIIEIGDRAFYNCKALKHVVIPDTVTSIGANAFTGCDNLEVVELPKSVKNIDPYSSFGDCKKLKEIKVDPENPVYKSYDGIMTCGNAIFLCPPQLDTEIVNIPQGIELVRGFQGNEHIKEVNIPEGATEIASCAFFGCKNLTTINLPSSLKKIGNLSFKNCGLTSISIPDDTSTIGGNAFFGCSNLKSVKLPTKLTTIAQETFRDCISLEEINLPDTLIAIASGAFQSCKSMEHIRLPKTLRTLDLYAFYLCEIKTVEVPATWVDKIKLQQGFKNCEKLIEY